MLKVTSLSTNVIPLFKMCSKWFKGLEAFKRIAASMMLIQPTFQMRFLNFRNIIGENLQSAFRVKIEMLVWRIHEFNVRAENCIPITPCTKLDKPKGKYEEIRIGRTQTKWEKIKILCNGMDYKWVGNSDSNLPHFLDKISHFMVRFIIYYILLKNLK